MTADPLHSEPDQGATGAAPPQVQAQAAPAGESPLSVESTEDAFAEHPERYVGAAFLGGLLAAQILRRLVR